MRRMINNVETVARIATKGNVVVDPLMLTTTNEVYQKAFGFQGIKLQNALSDGIYLAKIYETINGVEIGEFQFTIEAPYRDYISPVLVGKDKKLGYFRYDHADKLLNIESIDTANPVNMQGLNLSLFKLD